MNKILIVNGGSITDAFLERQYREYTPDRIIAVDGALSCFYRTGIMPTHIVGDFDTVEEEILNYYEGKEADIERHNPRKDETDSELAMKVALSLEPSEILVLGATGNRMDHTLANLNLLHLPFQKGIFCRITDECNEIFLVEKEAVLCRDRRWKYISFLPFTDEVSGITLEGFAYPLFCHRMTRAYMPGLGVSNEITGETAKITISQGILFCIRSSDRKKETV